MRSTSESDGSRSGADRLADLVLPHFAGLVRLDRRSSREGTMHWLSAEPGTQPSEIPSLLAAPRKSLQAETAEPASPCLLVLGGSPTNTASSAALQKRQAMPLWSRPHRLPYDPSGAIVEPSFCVRKEGQSARASENKREPDTGSSRTYPVSPLL